MAFLFGIVLLLLTAVSRAQTVPQTTTTLDTAACQAPFDTFPFCNISLSLDERVDDLISRLWSTNQSIIPLMLLARNFGSSAAPLIGVPEYDWGLHGVQSSCVAPSDGGATVCPTSFMNIVNFGNAWNKSLARNLGAVVGVETRGLWLAGAVEQSPRNHIGLDVWSPNINLLRDSRWGRAQETPSEDPLINGDFGEGYTRGLQEGDDPRYLQAAVTLKHWIAYSLEDSDNFTRNNFNAIVSDYAFASSYFPAFRQSVVSGGATGVMCSYNAVLGVPTCASPFLTHVLRDVWGFQGYMTSDSGALENIYDQHHYVNDSLHAVPVALRDGQTDVCSGNVYKDSLLPALAAGLVTREDINLALQHTLKLRMRLGLFDPPAGSPYWSVPLTAVGTPASAAASLLAVQESLVLLKNAGGLLPLAAGRKIAVIGPHANATAALVGNYLGQLCPDNTFSCIVSPFMALSALNAGGSVTLAAGCPVTKNDTSGFAAALAAAAAADVVVLALGIDLSVEGEAHDRTSIDLPAVQHALAAAVAAVGKPTVAFILRGGGVDVSAEAANPAIGALLDAGYPGFQGGVAIAQTLLGLNPRLGGKLAQTIYPASYVNEIPMSDMELDREGGPGRTYRFYTGTPVFPFGYGLALTNFSVALAAGPATGQLVTEADPSATLTYVVTVSNTGALEGDEVVQAYFVPRSTPSQPRSRLLKQLFSYQRLHLAPGAAANATFDVTSQTLRMVDKDTGNLVSTPGDFDILLTNGAGQDIRVAVTVTGEEVLVAAFPF